MTHEEILAKAKRDYYSGIKFKPVGTIGNELPVINFEIRNNTFRQFGDGSIDAGKDCGFLYNEGKWAKIISLSNKQLTFKTFI